MASRTLTVNLACETRRHSYKADLQKGAFLKIQVFCVSGILTRDLSPKSHYISVNKSCRSIMFTNAGNLLLNFIVLILRLFIHLSLWSVIATAPWHNLGS